MIDNLISREAAIDRLNATPPGNWSKARYTRELWNVPSIPAVPLDKLCALLAKNADCPPEHSPVQDHCKENCAECWKSVLKEWMEEQDALDRCRYTESPNCSQMERGKTLTGIDMVIVIDDAPTIDAVPMVHGRWIKGGYACGENEYMCSACGETEWRTGCARMKYCMHCGAKMDLEN